VLRAIDPAEIRSPEFRALGDSMTAGFDLTAKLDGLRQFIASVRGQPAPGTGAEERA
jgi:hypothetical protein